VGFNFSKISSKFHNHYPIYTTIAQLKTTPAKEAGFTPRYRRPTKNLNLHPID
jgi:hypothetical protein